MQRGGAGPSLSFPPPEFPKSFQYIIHVYTTAFWGPRSNLRGPKFPEGACPQTPLGAVYSTHYVIEFISPPPTKNPVWNPEKPKKKPCLTWLALQLQSSPDFYRSLRLNSWYHLTPAIHVLFTFCVRVLVALTFHQSPILIYHNS